LHDYGDYGEEFDQIEDDKEQTMNRILMELKR
jgi:hypothetical protein